MVYNIIDENNKFFMGSIDDFRCLSGPEHIKVTKPLLLQYEVHPSLGGSKTLFSSFDIVCLPEFIYAKLVTVYPAGPDQIEEYEKECAIIFKGN